MAKNTTWFACIVAFIAATAIGMSSPQVPYNENLIRLQTREQLVPIDPVIASEPIETQVILLSYSGDKSLLLNAWLALSKYPVQSRVLLSLYGAEPDFKRMLRTYGEAVVPVVKYFLDNDVLSLTVMDTADKVMTKIGQSFKKVWNSVTGGSPQNPPITQESRLDPVKRGWYAVQFIKDEGHQFLGQFVVDRTGTAKWNQTKRVTQAMTTLFTGGISNLEGKHDLSEDIEAADVFFAAIDVIPFVVSLKLLQAGKLASAGGREVSIASRTRILAPRLIPKSEFLSKLGKYGAGVATAYVIIKHPSLINSLLAEAASLLGVPAWLMQGIFWFVLIFLATYPFRWALKLMARAILSILSFLETSRPSRSLASQGLRAV